MAPVTGSAVGATWLELSVEADTEAVEAVSEILARVAPGGVSIEPAFELVDDGLGARTDPARPAVLHAYVAGADTAAAAEAARRVGEALGHLQAFGLRPIGELRTRIVDETDWAAASRRGFPVLRIGEHFVVRPTWRRHRRLAGDIVLALDPGVAFGTGLHPTTRLCMAGLEGWAGSGLIAGARLLDVGCGSGILGIGAALLGAATVLGVDTDPLAVDATLANARRNRVSGVLSARSGSLPTGEGPFDLVVANLIASLLVDLAARLYAEVRAGTGAAESGGRLLAGGIFADREAEVRRGLAAAGFRLRGRSEDGDWVMLEAERVG